LSITGAEKRGMKMKKLFYRLSSCRSFTRLLSVLTVAVVTFVAPGLLQAATGTKCNKPLTTKVYCDLAMTPAPKAKGTTCVASTAYKSTGSSCTGTVGGVGTYPTGSHVELFYQSGDLEEDLVGNVNGIAYPISDPPSEASESVCGPGFVDIQATLAAGQAISCKYTNVSGQTQPANCFLENWKCSCFEVGACDAKGQRKSSMNCPTPSADLTVLNAAGCTGTLTVEALNGTPLAGPVQIGAGQELLDTNGECGAEFPNKKPFKTFEMGNFVQTCDPTSNVFSDLIQTQNVRTNDGGFSTTDSNVLTSATCTNNNGFPTGACKNDGGTFITFAAAESGEQCVAANFSCGQLADGTPGPAPKECKEDSGGNCTCRCARCDAKGTLVNLGADGESLFVISSSDNAYACPVTVTGN
jgi:hypothetical protein